MKIVGLKIKLDNLWSAICDYSAELGAKEWDVMEQAFSELEALLELETSLNQSPKRTHEELIRELDNDPETIAWKVWTLADITIHTEEMMERDHEFKKKMEDRDLVPENVTEAAYEIDWSYLGDCTDSDWMVLEQGIEEIVNRFKI